MLFLREHDSVEGVDQKEQPLLDVIGAGFASKASTWAASGTMSDSSTSSASLVGK